MMLGPRISAERTVRECLERIEAREAQIGVWAFFDRDLVLKQARALDAASRRGPLHGIPVGIKDIIDTADMPTEYGSPIYAGHRPAWDAACVCAIRMAGGIILGKTVTTEFASLHPGKTRNPHNLAHTPGGSSSGSAAGVADGMMPLALGTQTGGSVIRPASFCGVVGYKPSFGLISRHAVKPLAESLDTVGVFARNVRDAALLVGAMTRRPEMLALQAAQAPRIGLWRTYEWREAAPESVAAVDAAAKKLAAAGADVREARMPQVLSALDEAQHAIQRYELSHSLAYESQAHPEQLSQRLRERVHTGAQVDCKSYDQAQQTAFECRAAMREVFQQFDVLLTPSAAGEAPRGLESTGDAVFNRGWTLLGLPCVTLPASKGPQGLPVGVQAVGPFRADAQLLAHAVWMEQVLVTGKA